MNEELIEAQLAFVQAVMADPEAVEPGSPREISDVEWYMPLHVAEEAFGLAAAVLVKELGLRLGEAEDQRTTARVEALELAGSMVTEARAERDAAIARAEEAERQEDLARVARQVAEARAEAAEAALREAVDLLRDARPDFGDPALRRGWGRKRRAVADAATPTEEPEHG